MPTANEKLAQSLERLKEAVQEGIVSSADLSQVHRERLIVAGFLEKIINGWYCALKPEARTGETSWYLFYWPFVRQYLNKSFGEDYCLSAEASLMLHAGSPTLPRQLLVLSERRFGRPLDLPGGLSLFVYKENDLDTISKEKVNGLNVMSLATALSNAPEAFFSNKPVEAQIALQNVRDVSSVLQVLLDEGKTNFAGRLAGAFRRTGQDEFADRIVSTMKKALYNVRETDPFATSDPVLQRSRAVPEFALRINVLWQKLRPQVLEIFPEDPTRPTDASRLLAKIEENYNNDAYNSLSIEGYRVTPELIEKVRAGDWDPDGSEDDSERKNALAARGYFDAFGEVKATVERIVNGAPVGSVRTDHHTWHTALFTPSVTAGILKASDLAGYRNHPVYINGSMHTPPANDKVPDAMSALFDMIGAEESAAVRAVLGHFLFVYIHPYGDGNGRLGRFLMNSMWTTGGYPWTVVRFESRDEYMSGLEQASVEGSVKPFAQCLRDEMQAPDRG